MSSTDHEISVPPELEADGPPGNTVAAIGLVLTVVAGLMCIVLFSTARGLPDAKSPEAPVISRVARVADEADSVDPEASEQDAAESARAEQQEAQIRAENEGRRLRVLLLASTTAMLNLVGLVLSVVGLFVPKRPRMVAVCGTILSLLLFAGIFGVMAVGALMNPATILVMAFTS